MSVSENLYLKYVLIPTYKILNVYFISYQLIKKSIQSLMGEYKYYECYIYIIHIPLKIIENLQVVPPRNNCHRDSKMRPKK